MLDFSICLFRFQNRALQYLLFLNSIFLINLSYGNEKFDPGIAPFELRVNGSILPHKIGFRAVLPGETLTLRSTHADAF
jgi:hypothetical protein